MASRRYLICMLLLGAGVFAWPGVSFARIANPNLMIMPIPPRPAPPWPGDGWVWVPPVYRNVMERVWQEGHYDITYERVWSPPSYGWRTVRYWDGNQWVEQQEWVMTSPGCWTSQPRQVWVEGGWTTRTRQIEVTPGHWEWRGPNPRPDPRPIPQPPTTRPPELAPFSPLWDWPEDSKKK